MKSCLYPASESDEKDDTMGDRFIPSLENHLSSEVAADVIS